jgi:hypothetical protein
MRTALRLVAIILLLTGFSRPLAAQHRADLRVGISAPATSHDASRLLPIRVESKSHWREGAIIGASLGFLLGAAMASYDSDGAPIGRRLVLGLAGAAVVMMPGALIGGLFPRGEKHDSTTVH